MKYRIKIETTEDSTEPNRYPSWNDRYEQIVDDLDIEDVIRAVIGFATKTK